MSYDRPALVLDFICRYKQAHAFSPSVGDIAVGCKLKTSQVRAILDDLEDAGRIVMTRSSIRLVDTGVQEGHGA